MKGGIDLLTRYLAKELGPRGVAVNAVAPVAIETDFGGGVVRDNAALKKTIAGQNSRPRWNAGRHRTVDSNAAFEQRSMGQRSAN